MFTILKNDVVLDTNTYLIPEYKVVIDTYGKEAIFVFKYIYMRYDFRATGYANLSEDKREEACQKDFNTREDGTKIFDTSDEIIVNAIKKYQYLQETPSMRLFYASRKSMEQLTQYFDTFELDLNLNVKDKALEIKTLTDSQSKVATILKNMKELEVTVKSEIAQGLARGNSFVGERELPKHQR